MSRIDGGNRPSSPKSPLTERSGFERAESSPAGKPAAKGTGTKELPNRTMQTFQGRSDFEPAGRTPPRGLPSMGAPTMDLSAIANADAELELLSEFSGQADAQGGLTAGMLHAHASEPIAQVRIVERLKQDGRLESLFGEVFRQGNAFVEQPHRNAVVRALGNALARGTVTPEDLRAFSRGAYAQEWQQIGSELRRP
jgi:hypothetical protein